MFPRLSVKYCSELVTNNKVLVQLITLNCLRLWSQGQIKTLCTAEAEGLAAVAALCLCGCKLLQKSRMKLHTSGLPVDFLENMR